MKRLKKILKILGPGFITGASDDDPSGIATYSQAGAIFGYGQLWTAPFTFPFMTAIQEMCGRIGLVTGRGLAGVIHRYYPKWVLFSAVLLLVGANTINIGTDLGVMAASVQVITGVPFAFLLLLMVTITLLLEIFVSYKTYVKFLKYLTFSLFAYIGTAFLVNNDWQEVFFSTIVPFFVPSKEYIMNIVAIFGTTISPYLFFWQSDEEVEEEVAHQKIRSFGAGVPRITPKDVANMRKDTIIGMFFSNLIMFFIILTAGATLHRYGLTDINTAQQAALALRPLAGEFAFLLFAFGIIGTGFLAVPILAGSAAYAISEVFGWSAGLYRKFRAAQGFYSIIVVATLIGFLINFIGINPIKALYYTAIINGLAAPFLIVVILFISNNKNIMGNRTNSWISNILGIIVVFLMTASGALLLWQLLS